MSTFAHAMRRIRRGGRSAVGDASAADGAGAVVVPPSLPVGQAVDIAPNDPLLAYLQTTGGVIEVERLELESPAVDALREAGVSLVVPLVSGGELIGTLNLGP